VQIEEERLDVMQNLEYTVASVFERNPEMTDYAVLRTYEALLQAYSDEIKGRTPRPCFAEGHEAELMDQLRSMCEWRLGRSDIAMEDIHAPECEPLDVPTLVLCLKRLVKSVKMWTRKGGRQGYLKFMSGFVL
jgi:hypothetical protein